MKKSRIFYGWWIVGALFFITAYASGVIFYGFTALLEPLINEFGWSYAQVSVAASLRGLETGLLVPLVGFLIDRFGPRKLIFTGAIIIGLGLFFFSQVTSLWMFYAAFAIMSTGMSTCSGVLPMAVVGNWFKRRVSVATGIAVSGSASGGLLVPLLTKGIEVFQWRTTMILLAIGVLVIVLPLSFVVRHKPELYGYLPDGDAAEPVNEDDTKPIKPSVEGIGVKQAMRTRVFWQLTTIFTFHALAVISVVTHIMPYLSSVDISKTVSSFAVSGIALAGITGRFSFGFLGDRFSRRMILAVAMGLTMLSLLLLSSIGNFGTWMVVPSIILFGIGFGGAVPVTSTSILDYFGRKNLGSILGIIMGIMMLGGMVGAPVTGWVYDTFRNYQGAWFTYAGILGIALICALTLPSIKKAQVN